MQSHGFAYPITAARRIDHERGIGNMRAAIGLVRNQLVHPDDLAIVFRHEDRSVVSEPVVQCSFGICRSRKNVGRTSCDDRLENRPHCIEICSRRAAYLHGSQRVEWGWCVDGAGNHTSRIPRKRISKFPAPQGSPNRPAVSPRRHHDPTSTKLVLSATYYVTVMLRRRNP
jgi:hypothetical protein